MRSQRREFITTSTLEIEENGTAGGEVKGAREKRVTVLQSKEFVGEQDEGASELTVDPGRRGFEKAQAQRRRFWSTGQPLSGRGRLGRRPLPLERMTPCFVGLGTTHAHVHATCYMYIHTFVRACTRSK